MAPYIARGFVEAGWFKSGRYDGFTNGQNGFMTLFSAEPRASVTNRV